MHSPPYGIKHTLCLHASSTIFTTSPWQPAKAQNRIFIKKNSSNIKIIINNTIDIWKTNVYDHYSYGSCFQPGLILIYWLFLICSGRTSGRITLHGARLSGVGCAGSIKTTVDQSQSPHPFTLDWWASGGISNAFLHRCLFLRSSALWGNEKILRSGLFYHEMKHFCLQIMDQQVKLQLAGTNKSPKNMAMDTP